MKKIDMHAHLWLHSHKESEKAILSGIGNQEIEKFYISGLSVLIPSKEQVYEANKVVAECIKNNPGKIEGYVYISPEHDNAVDVLKRGIEEQNMIGAKFWVSEKCDSMAVNPVAEKIIDYNIPLLIHAFEDPNPNANQGTAENVRNLALRYPELKIIMAHLGGNCYHGIPLIRDLKNVWVDISGDNVTWQAVKYTVDSLGADKVMFGSDMPGISYLSPIGKIEDAGLTQAEKKKIYYDNTVRLFDTDFKI